MRDPRRIDRMLQQLETAWRAFPDMRLGQLLLNITRAENTSVLWNIEDTQFEGQIISFTRDKIEPAGLRYIKRRWAESRGDQHDGYGHSWWYFEVDSALNVIRQIEQYDNGPILGYSSRKPHDDFGMLSTEALNSSLDSFESLSLAEFNDLWERRSNM